MEFFKTPLGQMKVLEIYLYYDRPFIFLCEDNIGTKYMVYFIDEIELGERWFLVPSSENRIEYVRLGKITLRKSIKNAEQGWVLELFIPYDELAAEKITKRNCSDIEDLDLPAEEAKLSLPPRTPKKEKLDVETEAKQKARNIILLSLDDGKHSTDISVQDYGAVLLRGQHLITALALECGSGVRGQIPKKTIEETSFNFTGTFVASIGVKLESKYGNLFDPCIEEALERFISLLSAGANKETLSALLKEIPRRATARYRFLLQALDQANVSFKMDWTSPHKGRKKAKITHSQIQDAIEILNLEGEDMTQVLTISGDLVGLLVHKEKRRSSFEFVEKNGEKIKGVLSQELLEQADRDNIPVPCHNIKVEVEETIEINPSTSEEHVSYTLIKILDDTLKNKYLKK